MSTTKTNPFKKIAENEKTKSKWLPTGTSIIIDLTKQPVLHTKIVNDRKLEYYTIETNYGAVEINAIQAMKISDAIDSPMHNKDDLVLTYIL